MDLSNIISAAGSGSGGSGSSWGAGLAIGGMAEQDIASFLTPIFTSKALRRSVARAEEKLNQGYSTALGNLEEGYQTGRGDITSGSQQSAAALESAYQNAVAAQQPYLRAGQEGLASLQTLGAFEFNPSSVDVTQDPGYAFRQQEGQRAVESSAAGGGGLLSGATLKALNKYGQNLASEEYGKAYERAYTSAKDTYGSQYALGTFLAGTGQQAAGTVGNYGMTTGANLADVYQTRGQNLSSLASGYGTNRANLATNQASNLANLQLMRGNINAGEWQGYGNAAIQQGQHLQEIGAGQLGRMSQ
jgi:hypothetical protein